MSSAEQSDRMATLPVGVVVRRTPGVTRWARHAWKAIAVLPGAGHGNWKELRREGDAVEFHAATCPMVLHRAETEGYLVSLNANPPSVFTVLRQDPDADRPEVVTVTASAYEAQDFTDNGEDIVEPVPMPPGLEAWIAEFVERHHVEEAFVKRKRRPHMEDRKEDGIGDARIRQTADVYRAPGSIRKAES